MNVIDDAELGRRMVQYLRGRGVDEQRIAAAAPHFASGALPSTSLRRAGIDRDHVLAALAFACGLPPAPPASQWTSNALQLTPVKEASWARVRAVPIGVADRRIQVAFADPKHVAGAEHVLPPHDCFCCLEEDFDNALHALVGGVTLGVNPPPPPSLDPRRASMQSPESPSTLPVSSASSSGSAEAEGAPSGTLLYAAPSAPGRIEISSSSRAASLDPREVGPWHIERRLAAGGMGVVYVAHDDAGRKAAVKLVHAHLLTVEIARTRFLREARATERLRHENIVTVLDVGEGDPAYLAVEFVDGGSLYDLLRARGPLPVAAALDALVQMLSGLVEAHAQAVVHRDLKPANLLLTKEGTLKIADFGIARELDATAITQTGSTLGTPAYMSPEQALAEPIDGRSDVYSAGVIAYEMLTGRNPFEAESIGAIVTNVLTGAAPRLFEVSAQFSESVDDLIASLMSRHIDQRPASASAALARARALFDDVRRSGNGNAAPAPASASGSAPASASPLGDVLRDASAADALRRREADDLVARARAFLAGGAAQREAAGLSAYRASLVCPGHVEAQRLLDALASQGVVFGPPSPRLTEIVRELEKKPGDPVLLQRAGQTARQDGNMWLAVAFWRRYLRVRPDDTYLQGQLARLTGAQDRNATMAVPAASPGAPAATVVVAPPPLGATVALQDESTMQRIAGHIATGGQMPGASGGAADARARAANARGPVGRNGLERRVTGDVDARGVSGGRDGAGVAVAGGAGSGADSMGGQVLAIWSQHKGKVFALAAAVVVVLAIVKGVGSFITGAQKSIEDSKGGFTPKQAVNDENERASEADLRVAEEALAVASFADAEQRAGAGLTRGAKRSVTARLYVARGRARMGLHKPLAAVEDFSRVIDGFRDDDVAYPEALLQRGIAHSRAGDGPQAKDDLSVLIERGSGDIPSLAEARVERGKIAAAAGDVAAARTDFQWARDMMAPGTPLSVAAREGLASLEGR